MPNNVVHFAIHATDLDRARAFYTAVFGWRFTAWGPPGFFLIETGTAKLPGIAGALHARSEDLTGSGMRGFECTIGVEDIEATYAAIVAAGGRVVYDRVKIPGVGTLVQFVDTESNVVGAMQYDVPMLGLKP